MRFFQVTVPCLIIDSPPHPPNKPIYKMGEGRSRRRWGELPSLARVGTGSQGQVASSAGCARTTGTHLEMKKLISPINPC
jgi:hypothetical protein